MRAHRDIFERAQAFSEVRTLQAAGLYPFFRRIDHCGAEHVICSGRKLVMLSSSDYLGLSHDPRVRDAAQEAVARYGTACSGSRLLNGTLKAHEQLEGRLASLLNKESALVFATGFMVGHGVFSALTEAGDAIVCDRENHASILDGANCSAARLIPFAHNDSRSLEARLRRLDANTGRLIALDSVFSMSGDVIDLPSMVRVAKRHGARLYLDEAHGIGAFGARGEGVAGHLALLDSVDLIMGTFSKALGGMGGFLAGPSDIISYIKHKARSFVFTAALAPSVVGAVSKALEIMEAEPERRAKLWRNVRTMVEGLRSIGLHVGHGPSQIVPIHIGQEELAFEFSRRLHEAGVFAAPVSYPAVRRGQAIVRTTCTANHSLRTLEFVLDKIRRVSRELSLSDVRHPNAERREWINKDPAAVLRHASPPTSKSRTVARASGPLLASGSIGQRRFP